MGTKRDSMIMTGAAMLVLFTALLDPLVSIILAITSLLGLAAYRYVASRKRARRKSS